MPTRRRAASAVGAPRISQPIEVPAARYQLRRSSVLRHPRITIRFGDGTPGQPTGTTVHFDLVLPGDGNLSRRWMLARYLSSDEPAA